MKLKSLSESVGKLFYDSLFSAGSSLMLLIVCNLRFSSPGAYVPTSIVCTGKALVRIPEKIHAKMR